MNAATATSQAMMIQPKSRHGESERLSSPGTYTPRESNHSTVRAMKANGFLDLGRLPAWEFATAHSHLGATSGRLGSIRRAQNCQARAWLYCTPARSKSISGGVRM